MCISIHLPYPHLWGICLWYMHIAWVFYFACSLMLGNAKASRRGAGREFGTTLFFVYTRPLRCHPDTNKTMKKLFLTVAIVTMTMLTSCKKSNADLIKDYDSVCKELVEATKNGDFAKVATLSEKGQKLENELRERELTDEEKSQLQEIQSKAASGIVSGAADGISNMIDSATDATETLSAVAVGDDNPNGVVE